MADFNQTRPRAGFEVLCWGINFVSSGVPRSVLVENEITLELFHVRSATVPFTINVAKECDRVIRLIAFATVDNMPSGALSPVAKHRERRIH
jgi:hypothetical protein